MAPKRPNPMEEPPTVSTTEEEEEETSSEEEGGKEEEESSSGEEEEDEPSKPFSTPPQNPSLDKKPSPKKPEITIPVTADTHQPQSDSDSGSESESDSESEPETPTGAPDRNVKPIATKPMEENPKTTKPRSKLASTSQVKSAEKRPSETDQARKDLKRAKKEPVGKSDDVMPEEDGKKPGEDAKKQLFQRLWSEDDEIAVLKGMLEYAAKKGANPVTDMDAFHDFIKKSIHIDVTRAQLQDKIRRLKRKYENNLGRGKKGEDRTFSKAHEQKAYDLSKKIWGSEGNSGVLESAAKPNGTAKKNQRSNTKALASLKAELLSSSSGKNQKDGEEGEKMEIEQNWGPSDIIAFDKNLGMASLDEFVIKQGLSLIEGPKKSELEDKWKMYRVAQMELFLQRTDLVREQAKLMLQAYKSDL